jgi:hypothetical protein
VPSQLAEPFEALVESDDLLDAVRRAIEHNRQAESAGNERWAVVVQPGSAGWLCSTGRLCTPISYQVGAVWWPDGWEPTGPLDVPNCVWHDQEHGGEDCPTYQQAVAAVHSLNRQCIDHPGTKWYVVTALENEPMARTLSYDASGNETIIESRLLHVIRPESGGRGDCSGCPAHSFPCATADWITQTQTVTVTTNRAAEGRQGADRK